jgi:hypothetical protein
VQVEQQVCTVTQQQTAVNLAAAAAAAVALPAAAEAGGNQMTKTCQQLLQLRISCMPVADLTADM